MLTPIELKEKRFKSGMGYNKKDVEAFFENISYDYEQLYKENLGLKDKLSVLSEGVQYYKNLEATLQKTLVLAEKTANETTVSATAKAETIEQEARVKADRILADARKQLLDVENQINALYQQFESYKAQFKQMLVTQSNLLESDAFSLKNVEERENAIRTKQNDILNSKSETKSKNTIVTQENNIKKSVAELEKTSEVLKGETKNLNQVTGKTELIRKNISSEVQKKEPLRRTIVPNLKREEPPKRIPKNSIPLEETRRQQVMESNPLKRREGFVSKTERSFRQGKTILDIQKIEPKKVKSDIKDKDSDFYYSSLDGKSSVQENSKVIKDNNANEMDDFQREILKYEKKDK